MANKKQIKRHRTRRVSIDDLFYKKEKENLLDKLNTTYSKEKRPRADILFDNNDMDWALVRSNTNGVEYKVYRNATDKLGRYYCYPVFNERRTVCISPNYFTVIDYFYK